MRSFTCVLILVSLLKLALLADSAEYPTLETVPWRRPSAYTQPVYEAPAASPAPTRQLPASARANPQAQRPATRAIEVFSPGYTLLNLPEPAPPVPRRQQAPPQPATRQTIV